MTNSTIAKDGQYSASEGQNLSSISQGDNQDQAIWLSLKQAIAKSSGFQRWQQEKNHKSLDNLDLAVRCYLKETLETLAY